jgi:hypothetical protein
MLTPNQKLKILQNFICLVAVNSVYSSGVQTNKEGKEKLVFKCFEAELALYNERRGRWANIAEYAKGEFGPDAIRATTKNSFLNSEKIWEKGMAARRELVSWLAEYGNILNFTVLKPMVEPNEIVDKSKFDLELNEDSGGNADLELLKILRKVQYPRIIRISRILPPIASHEATRFKKFIFRFMMILLR